MSEKQAMRTGSAFARGVPFGETAAAPANARRAGLVPGSAAWNAKMDADAARKRRELQRRIDAMGRKRKRKYNAPQPGRAYVNAAGELVDRYGRTVAGMERTRRMRDEPQTPQAKRDSWLTLFHNFSTLDNMRTNGAPQRLEERVARVVAGHYSMLSGRKISERFVKNHMGIMARAIADLGRELR